MPNPFRPASQTHHHQVLTNNLCRFLSQKKHQLPENHHLRICDIGQDHGEMALCVWKQLRKNDLKFHLVVLREEKNTANRSRQNIPRHAPVTVIEKNPLEILSGSSFTASTNGNKVRKKISKDDGTLVTTCGFDMIYTSCFLSTLSCEEICDWIALMTSASRLGLMACEPLKPEKSLLSRLKPATSSTERNQYTLSQWELMTKNLNNLKLKKKKSALLIFNKRIRTC